MDFDNGMHVLATFLENELGDSLSFGRMVRDVFGRLTFVLPSGFDATIIENKFRKDFSTSIDSYLSKTNPFLSSKGALSESLLNETGQAINTTNGSRFVLLDRRIAGDDWFQPPSQKVSNPARFAFYGLKGGVGRSTALAVAAADLAARGANVLTIDLDLESPGLDTVLLDQHRIPTFGIVDWLASGALGLNIDELLTDMSGGCPYTTGSGFVDVVPVSGSSTVIDPAGFLGKLARAYTPGASAGKLQNMSFTQKVSQLIGDLEKLKHYDYTLIDVRAGLHETSASSLIGLGATCFLFGTDAPHTMTGYQILLASLRRVIASHPTLPDLRDRFQMVQGKASSNLGLRREFISACWQVWLDNLYDEDSAELDPDIFSYDLDDETAPHYPWMIQASDSYISFSPRKNLSFLNQNSYAPIFGDFINRFRIRTDKLDI